MKADRPGSKRLLTELLEWAQKHEGTLPTRKSLASYSDAEVRDIQLQLPREVWGFEKDKAYVRVKELYTRSFGSQEIFIAHICSELGRPFINAKQAMRARIEQALDLLARANLPEPTATWLAESANQGKDWVLISLDRDGPTMTAERLTKLAALLQALPAAGEEPIRQFAARILRDSHALDDDFTLQVAFDSDLAHRHPESSDLEDVYRAEGLLQRLSHGVVLFTGPIALDLPMGRLDFSTNRGRMASAITEAQLASATLSTPLPRAFLFVENPSAWETISRQLPQDIVCILTDGNPTRACQSLCRVAGQAGVPILHWGDVDVGGLRILRFLQTLARVEPLLMGVRDMPLLAPYVTPLKGQKIEHFREHASDPVIAACLRVHGWFEQESIPTDVVVSALERALAAGRDTAPFTSPD